jgi:hypothetical protein
MKPGTPPEEVAQLFYKHMAEGNKEEWLATFTNYHQRTAKSYGSSPDLYWRAYQKIKCTYRYLPEKDERSENSCRFWFQRIKADGTETGMPLPIRIMRDEESGGEWRVDVATI